MNRKRLVVFIISLILVADLLFGYTRDWTESTPTDNTIANQIDDYNRYLRVDVAERLENQIAGFNASDSNEGFYQALFIEKSASPSTPAANKGLLYGLLTDTKCELTWMDESGNEIQLTSKGNRIANDTYFTATDNAGTGSVNLIKADANDNIFLGTYQVTDSSTYLIGHATLAKTTAYTVTAKELKNNITFTNTGTSAVVPFTLPTGSTGDRVGFLVTDTDGIQIDPQDAEQFYMFAVGSSTAGKYITSTTVGAYVELVFDGTYWTIIGIIGVWDIES